MGDVFPEHRGHLRAECAKPGNIGSVQDAIAGWRNVEQQFPVSADRREVQSNQVVDRPNAIVLGGMIEPAGTYRDIDLRWSPHRAVTIAVLQRVIDARSVLPRKCYDVWIDGRPVGVAGRAAFVPAPADIGAGVGEHHRIGLESSYQAEEARPVVDLTLAVGSFPVRAVEPDFGDWTVAGQQFGQLIAVQIVVTR